MSNDTVWKDHIRRNEELYKPKVLSPKAHFYLVEEIARYCSEAGIAEEFVSHSMLDFCQDAEIDWMRNYASIIKSGGRGLAFVGSQHSIVPRMSAIIGCALRNYIRARLTTLQVVISDLKEGIMPADEILAISNFCLPKNQGGAVPSWQLPLIIGLLYERSAQKKQTVVYVSSMLDLKSQYGVLIADHIERYFTIV